MTADIITIPTETIISKIFLIRGKKVMFDKDLAEIYGVSTGSLNLSVQRNKERFPEDFTFKLSEEEHRNLILQFEISRWGGSRHLPNVFTEQGVAMLSSVLKSKRAVQMNIQIIRTFTKLREILSENKKLAEKIEEMEKKYDLKISQIFKVLKYLTTEEEKPKEKMGFNVAS